MSIATGGRKFTDRAEEVSQLLGRAHIKPSADAIREFGDLAKGECRRFVISLLEHKNRNTPLSEGGGLLADGVDLLLKGVADKNDYSNRRLIRLAQGVSKDAANLGIAGLAIDLGHHSGNFCRVAQPWTGAAFAGARAAAKHKLHVDTGAGRLEHFGL